MLPRTTSSARRVAATVAIAATLTAGSTTVASAATSKPRIQFVEAAIQYSEVRAPIPYVDVKATTGTTSSIAVFWMGNRVDLNNQSFAPGTAPRREPKQLWRAELPGLRPRQRVRLQITASGPGGVTTLTRTVQVRTHGYR